ncbi:tetratricopeptide repeat protein [Candidatus Uabimicrobium amorphum]|uniref:Tetratricopeptide repeat domain protein n=1 Tax=Uabimicrobium amorphum TaxID=2596890 RepID=A0A5S9IQQ8_UABAM|nr:tetratricopeptide repeat protein [Candidatus Uabimicrobium amorphum]BBM85430.1 tetratricopeptide repeat domain protein [Candidatus Uabimicrobium amorphum]
MIDSFDGEYKENLLHAEELEYSGDYKSAAELYSHLATTARLKKDPQWNLIIALLMHAIYCFQKSNQVERVNTFVDRMEKLRNQHNADGNVSIGQTLYNTEHYELICGFDRDFVNKSDMQLISFLKTLQTKAREAESEKNFRIAAARYARIGELHKRIHPIDYKSLCESLEKAGHYLNLIKSYRQALFFYQEAMKINTRLDNEEHIAVNYNNISFIYTQLGDFQEALHYCQKALAINERLQNREQKAVNISNLGQIYLKSENYDKALKNFAHAIELKTRLGKRKDIAQEMYNLGMVYSATKKYKAAIARIENAVNMMSQLSNKEEVARYSSSLGDLYEKFGQRDMAIQYLEKSFSTYYLVNKKVRAAEVLHILARLHEEEQNYEQAIKCIRQNIAIQENLGNVKLVESHLKKVAQVYYELQDYKEAIGYYIKATELEKETYTPELRYRDFLTIGLWYIKANQRKKSIEYLQKAAAVLDDDSDIPQDEVYFFLGENFAELKKWSDALDCLYHAYNTSSHWYRKNIHLLKIANVYIKSEKYKDAKKCFNSITQFCQANRQTQNALLISVTKWQNAVREHEEVQSYYLEIFTLCSVCEFYWQSEKYSIAIDYALFALNLLKDIIAVDAKGIYQEKYNQNLHEFSIEPLFDRHQRFEQQIQRLQELFVAILQKSRQDIPAIRSAISQLFNANDSLYGIEFCEQLLLTAEPYISRTNQAHFLSQMGLRFKQLKNFAKSIFYYACSCSVYISSHAGELFLFTLDKLNASWKMFLEDPQDFDFNSCDYIEEVVKTAYGLAEKSLYLQLVEHVWNTYSRYELEDMAEIHLVKSCEMCVAMGDVERQIDFLELLSDCYRIQGKDEKVIATQVTVCDLRAKIEKEKQEEDVFSDTYLPLDLPAKNEEDSVADNPNTLQKMGETYMSLKRYEDALLNLNALLSLYEEAEDAPKVANTLLRIAGVHEAQEHYGEAIESLKEGVAIARSVPDESVLRKSIIKYHELYAKSELFSEGIVLFEQMLKTDKDHEEFFALETYFLANLLEKDGQTLQAIEHYNKALQLYEAAEEKNEHIDHLFCLQRLIDLYKDNGNYAAIITTYQKLFVVCEQMKLQDTLNICKQELYSTCWDYYQSFLTAKDKEPFLKNIFDVLNFLAENKWQEGKTEDISYDESVASLREACHLYNKISEFCGDKMSEVAEEKNQCFTALSETVQALGDYHMNFDNYERAIAYYEEDAELQETLGNSREKIDVFLKLAAAYEKSEDFENAVGVFDNAIGQSQDICSAEERVCLLFEAAKAYFKLENFSKVREYGGEAMSIIDDSNIEDSDLKNEIEKLMISSDG